MSRGANSKMMSNLSTNAVGVMHRGGSALGGFTFTNNVNIMILEIYISLIASFILQLLFISKKIRKYTNR